MMHLTTGYWYAVALSTAPALLARLVHPGAGMARAPRARPRPEQRAHDALPVAGEYLSRVMRLSPAQVDELARLRARRGLLRSPLRGLPTYRGARMVQALVRSDPGVVSMDDVRAMARLATRPSGELCADAFMALWEGYAALLFREQLPPKLFQALYAPSASAVPLDALPLPA